jgi:hypothetical protein
VVLPQNHWDGFLWFGLKTGGEGFLRFGLKTGGSGFSRFGLKIGGSGFFRFVPQNRQLTFGDFGLKITAMISWFGSQNQVGFGLLVAPQNR